MMCVCVLCVHWGRGYSQSTQSTLEVVGRVEGVGSVLCSVTSSDGLQSKTIR